MPLRPNFTKAPEESPAEVDVFGGWLAGKTGCCKALEKELASLKEKIEGCPA